jgi:shikimate kinase
MIAEERRNIILCGFMATGKSAVGKRLSGMIDYDFLDMDAMIEAETGMSIPQIFSTLGEPAFRELESQMAERLAGRVRCVIASGGGTIANQRNLDVLKRTGIIITLKADPQTILSRIGTGYDRPMLEGDNKLERISILLKQRAQAYGKADIMVDTSSKSVDEVARHILDRLYEMGCRIQKR